MSNQDITFDQFQKVMSFDLKKRYCIEILFSVNGSVKFDRCWMGKTPDRTNGDHVYWFALTEDGKNVYDYTTFEKMTLAKVFDGKSFYDLWNHIAFISVDGCEPTERFEAYMSGNGCL